MRKGNAEKDLMMDMGTGKPIRRLEKNAHAQGATHASFPGTDSVYTPVVPA